MGRSRFCERRFTGGPSSGPGHVQARGTRSGCAAGGRRSARREFPGSGRIRERRQVWGVNDFDDAYDWRSRAIRAARGQRRARCGGRSSMSRANQVCEPLLAGCCRRPPHWSAIPGQRASPRAGHVDERNAGRSEDILDEKLLPKNNPTVDARELPRGLEDMFRASFRPVRSCLPPAAIARWARQPRPAALHRRGDERARYARAERSCRRRNID